MDVNHAEPWLAHKTNLSQDELALIVLGRRECPTHSVGRRVQIPAYCVVGEPLVLAGCLHNLGRKKVTTATVQTGILTPRLSCG